MSEKHDIIKPCPFCGNDMPYVVTRADNPDHGHIVCGGCQARGPFVYIRDHTDWIDDAIDEWNDRYDEAEVEKFCKDIEERTKEKMQEIAE